MDRIKIILIFVFLQYSILLSCCKKPQVTQEEYPTNLEVLWNAKFYSDGEGDFFLDYTVANEQYIVLANTSNGIGVYNLQTGERHSAWRNEPGGFTLQDCKVAGKNKDIILIYSSKELLAYSLHTGQRMWKLNLSNVPPKMSTEENYAFISYGANGGLSKSWNRLAIVDVYSGQKTDILQLNIEDNYEFAINPPSIYVRGGDTLLFFTTSGWNFAKVHGRVHAYCYNLTKKQMLWTNKQFTVDTDASSAQPPPFVIENDKLIVTSLRAIHCFNFHTGELIWQKEGLGFADKPPLYYEGKIYIRSGNPCTLMCLDAQSGQVLWQNTTMNPNPASRGKMAIYKDRLYFSFSGGDANYYLGCVDILTGKELWRDLGPHENIAFGVLIDQKTGYLYCNTGWSTMCVDLNKTPNGKKDK